MNWKISENYNLLFKVNNFPKTFNQTIDKSIIIKIFLEIDDTFEKILIDKFNWDSVKGYDKKDLIRNKKMSDYEKYISYLKWLVINNNYF